MGREGRSDWEIENGRRKVKKEGGSKERREGCSDILFMVC